MREERGRTGREGTNRGLTSRSFPWHFVVIFLLLSIGIWTAGYLYYEKQQEYMVRKNHDNLSTIADLKVSQIVNWREERMADAEVVLENPFIALRVRKWFENEADAGLKSEIGRWMDSLQAHYRYKTILLLDSKGDIRFAVPDGKEILGPGAKKLVAEAMRTRKVVFSDLYRNKTTHVIRLSVAVPLLVSGSTETLPVGALVLRIDPFHFLYPLIQTWPTQSPTAETLLIRREGEGILYLNELRHQKNTALSLQLPVSRKTLPAAMAVTGRQGIVEGVDYRGTPVLAALRAIPDSSWFLVAKVDRSEVFAPIRERFWIVTVMVGILIFSSGLSVILFWRYQRASELKKYRETLEEEITARTHELEVVNKELEAFSYSVSHDLRAPLRAIDGFSRVVTEDYEDKLDDEGKRLLKIVSDNAQKMGQLIDDLLAFSRIGRQEIKSSQVDMENLARTVFEEIRSFWPGRRIQLNITSMPAARGDRTMVRQILVNLLSNAVKFTKTRENAVLEVGCKSGEHENIYFVKDNGAGFDMRYVDKLFCVFQRLHDSEEFEGTGVGLAIVQRIVRRHGGRVWAEGKVNEGAAFYFTLPAAATGDEERS